MSHHDIDLICELFASLNRQSDHFKTGFSRQLHKAEKPLAELTINEVIGLMMAYQAYYKKVLGNEQPIIRSAALH
ncbi:MAG: hypothetical protein KGZ88_12005 [Methylomicrobium sp.]|nr:hypothetical protein [Methylomicrobium sp.]